jgi:hypothetical protein
VTGSFDPQLIAGMFPSMGKGQVKVVGEHAILIGDGESFTQAVGRLSGSAASPSGDELARASDIWLEISGEMLNQQAGQQNSPMLKDVRAFSVGLTLSESPVIDMVVTVADSTVAATYLTLLKAMTPMLATSPAAATLARDISMTQDGANVRAHLVMPPEMLAMLQQQASAMAGSGMPAQLAPLLGSFGIGGAAAPAGKSPARPAEAPPQNGGKIKIYGLDDGPKELPAPK